MVRTGSFFYGCFVLGCLFLISGCRTVGQGLRFRTYAQDKPRVDQSMTGNAGYVMGKPKQQDRSGMKKTRRIYVFETTKVPDHQGGVEVDVEYPKGSVINLPPRVERKQKEVVTTERKIVLPSFESVEEFVEEEIKVQASDLVDYTVLKNDTMQKISKKFYGSYSKWPRIYDENRGVIKDPNRLKPGTQIKIPVMN